MLPAPSRMRRSGDFRTAVRSGTRAGGPTVVVHAANLASGVDVEPTGTPSAPGLSPEFSTGPRSDGDTGPELTEALPTPFADPGMTPRVGFVVSKAVGNSVTRNRVKRRLRHLSRPLVAQTPPDTLVVVRALPGAATQPQRLEDDLTGAWRRALTKLSRREADRSREHEGCRS